MRFRFVVAAVAVLSGLSGGAYGSEYSSNWGPAVGSRLPVLEAYDQSGQRRTLADLAGENGLLLFMSRSADW
jgi:hypothetical protein